MPVSVPVLVEDRPLPVKLSVLDPYDVVSVFISAVDVIVLDLELRSRPRAALDASVDGVSADVTSRPSAEDE